MASAATESCEQGNGNRRRNGRRYGRPDACYPRLRGRRPGRHRRRDAAGQIARPDADGPLLGYDTQLTGANAYEETAGSDVVVITIWHRPQAGHEPR